MGEGKVNYPLFIRRLAEIGYQGPITIEREISGEQQAKDIQMACDMLRKLFAENNALWWSFGYGGMCYEVQGVFG